MRVIQAWFNNVSESWEDLYKRYKNNFRGLILTSFFYKKLFPDDYLVLYCTSNVYIALHQISEDFEAVPFLDQVVDIGNMEGGQDTPVWDTSRFEVIQQQLEPFIYLDADFWVTEESKESIESLKQAILTTPGFYLAYWILEHTRFNFSITTDNYKPLQQYLVKTKFDSEKWINKLHNWLKEPQQYCHSVVCGGTPLESSLIGREVCQLHKFLTENYRWDFHEYSSSLFCYLVGRVYGFNVSGDYCIENAEHSFFKDENYNIEEFLRFLEDRYLKTDEFLEEPVTVSLLWEFRERFSKRQLV